MFASISLSSSTCECVLTTNALAGAAAAADTQHLAQILSCEFAVDGRCFLEVQMNRMNVEQFEEEWPTQDGEEFSLYKRYTDMSLVNKVTLSHHTNIRLNDSYWWCG